MSSTSRWTARGKCLAATLRGSSKVVISFGLYLPMCLPCANTYAKSLVYKVISLFISIYLPYQTTQSSRYPLFCPSDHHPFFIHKSRLAPHLIFLFTMRKMTFFTDELWQENSDVNLWNCRQVVNVFERKSEIRLS